jgi:hypothetical protein
MLLMVAELSTLICWVLLALYLKYQIRYALRTRLSWLVKQAHALDKNDLLA